MYNTINNTWARLSSKDHSLINMIIIITFVLRRQVDALVLTRFGSGGGQIRGSENLSEVDLEYLGEFIVRELSGLVPRSPSSSRSGCWWRGEGSGVRDGRHRWEWGFLAAPNVPGVILLSGSSRRTGRFVGYGMKQIFNAINDSRGVWLKTSIDSLRLW